jgi:hypothetical protein
MFRSSSGKNDDRPRSLGNDKVRVNWSSLEGPLTILADWSLEVAGLGKQVMARRVARAAEWLNRDPTGMVDAGYGPAAK